MYFEQSRVIVMTMRTQIRNDVLRWA